MADANFDRSPDAGAGFARSGSGASPVVGRNQAGNIIHYIGRPATLNMRLAQKKGFKVVVTDLLDQTASRSSLRLFAQRTFNQTFGRLLLKVHRSAWLGSFSRSGRDRLRGSARAGGGKVPCLGLDPQRGHVIPHGLEETTLRELAQPQPEEDYVVSVATIDPRKNSVLLAEAALLAKTPILVSRKALFGR